MTRRDWIKVILFVLIPINTWLVVLFYQKIKWWLMWIEGERRENEVRSLELEYIRRTRFRIQLGAQMPNIFAFAKWVGSPIVLGTGRPTLFLHIAWIAEPEVWKLAIDEALNSNPNLQIILLYDYAMMPEKKAFELANNMWHKWNNHRISISMSPTWYKVFGDIHSGILAVFCDEKGVVRHIEPYPHLRVSPYWSEEVADWRPKLQQAVKKVLDKFFTKGQGR